MMSEIGCRNRKWNSNGRFGDIAGANVGVSGTFVTSHQGALTQNNIINVHFRNKPFPFQQKIQKTTITTNSNFRFNIRYNRFSIRYRIRPTRSF